ncbi:MAG: host-nuclease inhibitor Gam family protein [Porticoccaceae bacterium]
MKKQKIKAEATRDAIPQDREECVDYIARIGVHQRERERIQATMNDELAAIRLRYEGEARPHADGIRALSHGVQIWCEANRAVLTNGGKVKTARLGAGEVRWRKRPPKVVIRGMEAVIAALHDLRLSRFVRKKEEINKEAILEEPEAVRHVKGITIDQGEDFVIVPFETALEEVA